jgi:hypothetical protein
MKNNARQTPALTEQEQQYVQAHEDEYNNRTKQGISVLKHFMFQKKLNTAKVFSNYCIF